MNSARDIRFEKLLKDICEVSETAKQNIQSFRGFYKEILCSLEEEGSRVDLGFLKKPIIEIVDSADNKKPFEEEKGRDN